MPFMLAEGMVQLSTRGFDVVEGELGRLRSNLTAGITSLGSLGMVALGSLAGAAAAITAFVGAHAAANDATIKLRDALEGEGQAIDANSARLEKYAETLGRVANVNKWTILGLESQVLRMGVSAEQAGQAVAVAQGLAKRRGVSDEEAVRAVTLAIMGQEMGLRRLIGLRRGAGLSGNALLEEASTMGRKGLMERQADEAKTFSGQLRTLRIQLESAAVAIGKVFTPAIQPIIAAIIAKVQLLRDWFQSLTTAQTQNILKWTALALGIGGVIAVMPTIIGAISTLGAVVGFVTSPIGLLVAGLAALAAAFVYALTPGDNLSQKLSTLWNHPAAALRSYVIRFQIAMLTLRQMWDNFTSGFEAGLKKIGLPFLHLVTAILGPIGILIEAFQRLEKSVPFDRIRYMAVAALGPIVALEMKLLDMMANAEKVKPQGKYSSQVKDLQEELKKLKKEMESSAAGTPKDKDEDKDKDKDKDKLKVPNLYQEHTQGQATHTKDFFEAWTRAQTAAMGVRGIPERQLAALLEIRDTLKGAAKATGSPAMPMMPFAIPTP